MSAAAATAAITFSRHQKNHHYYPRHLALSSITNRPSSLRFSLSSRPNPFLLRLSNSGGDGGFGGGNSGGGGGGGGGGGDGGGGDEEEEKNRRGALVMLAEMGRSLESLPKDLAAAVEKGKIGEGIVKRFADMEKSPLLRWLMQFAGFRERLLADDLFLAKVGMECGVGIFTKTAAEWERRRENFMKELDFVIADVVMAIVADFMLVWLPAPTVSLKPPIAFNAGPIAKFLYSCPENAFQVALGGASYSLFQRIGAIVIGTSVTNALIKAKQTVDVDAEVEDVPIVATSVAYGVYMAVSSNLRYQLLAGVIEQRIMEPLLHNHKLVLSALCFAVRTGNTFVGSLLWVDYARLVGIQKAKEAEENV